MNDNYTKLHNEVLEALAQQNLSGAQLRILLIIWRRTYGFHKKSYSIPVYQFIASTNLSKKTINRSLKFLKEKKIIFRSGTETGFSKEFMKLNDIVSRGVKNDTLSKMSQKGVKNVQNRDKNDTIYKEIKKEIKKKNPQENKKGIGTTYSNSPQNKSHSKIEWENMPDELRVEFETCYKKALVNDPTSMEMRKEWPRDKRKLFSLWIEHITFDKNE